MKLHKNMEFTRYHFRIGLVFLQLLNYIKITKHFLMLSVVTTIPNRRSNIINNEK
ncbi:hypothetical protein SPHINGO8BC_60623 [Sphingobacterium multivorum]|uniref:Uncharacterized protein n=1 Tax=Sphingobacterium multivorum TaxID=28454 RepID=A0A654DIF0_SPHMU|nr:hypothetical protein SPHINGO8BC_60623 [Sphingobacterium multivorum]